ncbi:MAG: hypothetical protein AAB895_01010, partial [Patescibacteria group bacterium]
MKYDPIIRRGNRLPFALKLAFVVAVILILLYLFIPTALSSFFTMIVRPFWNIEMIDQENQELKMRLAEREGLYARSSQLLHENEELKSLLGRSASSTKTLAIVLKKPPLSAYDIFVLDIGEENGVIKGNKVYALGNILVG